MVVVNLFFGVRFVAFNPALLSNALQCGPSLVRRQEIKGTAHRTHRSRSPRQRISDRW
jgi:hypothetical protein